ncbi:MAG: hypothetical protein IKH95_06880, partial [Bacteroidaceae bacterium]|nr:hypothetical protein [Bacteroidaceae bacterium]
FILHFYIFPSFFPRFLFSSWNFSLFCLRVFLGLVTAGCVWISAAYNRNVTSVLRYECVGWGMKKGPDLSAKPFLLGYRQFINHVHPMYRSERNDRQQR